jgi:flagellar hook-length control protein FliK
MAGRNVQKHDRPDMTERNVKEPARVGMTERNVKELDQVNMVKIPETKQNTTGTHSPQIETMRSSFKQAAATILEKKGFSVEEIKGIMNAIDETAVSRAKPEVKQASDQSVFIRQSFHHREIMKEVSIGRNNIHADIYQKEASLEDFRQKNIDPRIVINPLEKQTLKDGPQKDVVGKPENSSRSGKKNVFSGPIRETENPKTTIKDNKIEPQTTEKVITSRDRDDRGKRINFAGEVDARMNHRSHEDNTVAAGREESPLSADVLTMATKAADIHNVKAAAESSKTVYQTVVDQIQDGFSLAQNKENGQVRLTLKPEIMGHLDMQIAVRNDTVQIMMTVESEKVHQAMNAHIDDLKTALQNQGLKIDKIEVTLQYQPDQERTFYQDQAKSQLNNPGQNSHHERMVNHKPAFGDDHYPVNGQAIIQKQSSTEGVSIFA